MCKNRIFNSICKTRRVTRCLQHLQNANRVRGATLMPTAHPSMKLPHLPAHAMLVLHRPGMVSASLCRAGNDGVRAPVGQSFRLSWRHGQPAPRLLASLDCWQLCRYFFQGVSLKVLSRTLSHDEKLRRVTTAIQRLLCHGGNSACREHTHAGMHKGIGLTTCLYAHVFRYV
jgi:hypothetical protein